jgi:hypothetical protein
VEEDAVLEPGLGLGTEKNKVVVSIIVSSRFLHFCCYKITKTRVNIFFSEMTVNIFSVRNSPRSTQLAEAARSKMGQQKKS